jgi:hypothetical protein
MPESKASARLGATKRTGNLLPQQVVNELQVRDQKALFSIPLLERINELH